MDEADLNARPKRTRVLRATDVIPPFDKETQPAADSGARVERQERVSAEPDAPGHNGSGDLAVAVSPARDTPERAEAPAAVVEIPSYDLAANILAEQRRVASRRRRAPSQTDDQPPAAPAESGARVSIVEFPSQDLGELQQVVAEIVARDIERLCRRPNQSLSA